MLDILQHDNALMQEALIDTFQTKSSRSFRVTFQMFFFR